MRRVIAAFLLVCLGTMFPLAATPVRLCLLNGRVMLSEDDCRKDQHQTPCCPDCKKKEKHGKQEPCCMELDELPELPLPAFPEGLPAIASLDLPPPVFLLPPPVLTEETAMVEAIPIRGPDGGGSWRALLEVWRL